MLFCIHIHACQMLCPQLESPINDKCYTVIHVLTQIHGHTDPRCSMLHDGVGYHSYVSHGELCSLSITYSLQNCSL